MFEFSPINVEMMKIFGGGCKVRYFGGFSNIVSRVDFFSTVYNNPSLYRYIKVGPF